MTPQDLKRLMTGFLVLAVTTSSLALVFMGFSSESQPIERAEKEIVSDHLKISKNAFQEPLPDTIAVTPNDFEPLPAISPANLTDNLAYTIADNLLKVNPSGPKEIAGQLGAEVPALDVLVEKFTSDPKVLSQAYADQNIPRTSARDVKILDNYSDEDLQKYLGSINEILNEKFASQQILRLLNQEPSLEAANAIEPFLAEATKNLKLLSVPKKFAGLHVNLIEMLSLSLDSLNANLSSTDPLRELLDLQFRAERIMELSLVVEKELFEPNDVFSLKNSRENFFLGLFLIRTTHAIGIPTFDASNLAQWIWSFVKSLLLNLLKDRIIHQLVNQTIKWVQGGGKPQFITDWKGFLKGAANTAVGEELFKISPKLCQSFGPLITVALQPVNVQEVPVNCTLDQVVRNVKDFYDSFSKGGWIAYGASINPSNNFFGSLIQANDLVIRERAATEAAAKSDAESGEGFLSTKICVKSRIENPRKQCEERNRTRPPDTLPSNCSFFPNEDKKICEKYEVTTPGTALGHTVYDALGAPIQRIVNADDLIALASALINAALNKLIALGKSAVNKGLAGVNVDAGDTPPVTGNPFAVCDQITDPPARNSCVQQICSGLPDPKPDRCTIPEGGKCGPDAEARGCRCTGPGGEPGLPPNDLSRSDFDWRDKVDTAQGRVAAAAAQECQSGGTNTKGLNCDDSPDFRGARSVTDGETYTTAVAASISQNEAPLRGGMVQGDEVGVANGKSEHYDIVALEGSIWINEVSICTPPISPPF